MSAQEGRVLAVRDLTVRSGDGRALVCGASLALAPGEVLGLVGETGSGKTMTARASLRLEPSGVRAQAALRELAGVDVQAASEKELAELLGRNVGFVPQNTATFLHPLLRVRDQLTDGYVRWHGRSSRAEALERAHDLVEALGIDDPDRVLGGYPGALSGGMRQRVNIAMALMGEPRLVVADEPTAALDAMTRGQVCDLLVGAARERGAALLLVSHDLGMVRRRCDRVMVMYAGRIVEEGPCARVVDAPAHPYTAALLAAAPRLAAGARRARLAEMGGSMPEAGRDRACCPFAPRCDRALPACFAQQPPWADEPGDVSHRALCLRAWEGVPRCRS